MSTIGQNLAMQTLEKFASLPSGFIILVGGQGMGKRHVLREAMAANGKRVTEIGYKVNDIREMISDAYNNGGGRVYLVHEGDKLTISAQNAMLKLCEEPPKNAQIVLCLTNINKTLPTIASRGKTVLLSPYTEGQLKSYLELTVKGKYMDNVTDLTAIVSSIGEINELISKEKLVANHTKNLDSLVRFTLDNAFKVSASNFLNISKYLIINDKETEEKVYFDVFLKCLITAINKLSIRALYSEDFENYCKNISWSKNRELINISSKALNKLSRSRPLEQTIYSWAMEVCKI